MMNAIKYLWVFTSLIALISCDKNENEVNNLNVETYIKLLKSNQYDSIDLPAFTDKDIPALLQYRNDTQTIKNFPHNPISSYYGPECKLGMYVLWTIESIRAVSINSNHLIKRFPSQNPILAFRNSVPTKMVTNNISHSVAANAYYNWWQSNVTKSFDQFKDIDPLAHTDYEWK